MRQFKAEGTKKLETCCSLHLWVRKRSLIGAILGLTFNPSGHSAAAGVARVDVGWADGGLGLVDSMEQVPFRTFLKFMIQGIIVWTIMLNNRGFYPL